jgi:UPF0176 protein
MEEKLQITGTEPAGGAAWKICALYHFVALPDFEAFRESVLAVCRQNQAVGTILLAHEGINGTIAAPGDGIDRILEFLRSDDRLAGLDAKFSWCNRDPFYRLKVKLKREIVTMGVPEVDPTREVGEYVDPEEWNELISDPDVVVVDTRNDYEVRIGTFENAINPQTQSFREFPEYVDSELADFRDKKVAMFCTGGIRCEKATSYLLSRGFKKVYHLKGGILKYLEKVPKEKSLWRGECFVFDNRVTVRDGLEPGNFDQCHACRHPLARHEMQSPLYIPGVSCPHCAGTQSEENRRKAEARQQQIELAKKHNRRHIGQKIERQSKPQC